MFPLKVSSKDRIEWAVKVDGDWVIVDKSILEKEDVPTGLEKLIGFEGKPDPGSGYYCFYNEGRLVNSEVDVKPPSKNRQ